MISFIENTLRKYKQIIFTKTIAIYAICAINSFGSFCTILAINLMVQKKYGNTALSISWLISSLSIAAFSRNAARSISDFNLQLIYIILQIILAINVFILSINFNLFQIYFFLSISSYLSAISSSIFRDFISKNVEENKIILVFQKMGGITTSIMSIAPIIGAYLAAKLGFNVLLIIDSLSFFISGFIFILVFGISNINSYCHTNLFQILKIFLTETLKSYIDLCKANRMKLKSQDISFKILKNYWYLFLFSGAFINIIEFPLFNQRNLSIQEVGYILTSWGLGNLIVIFLNEKASKKINVFISTIFFSISIIISFISTNFITMCIFFLIGGFFYTVISGNIKGNLQINIPENTSSIELWAHLSQRMSIINISVFTFSALIFKLNNINYLIFILILFLFILLIFSYELISKKQRKTIS